MLTDLVSIHYTFEDLGVPLSAIPDVSSVYIVQDAYTRQFYPDCHEKFLMVAQNKFDSTVDSMSYTRSHGIIDTLTGIIALRYDPKDSNEKERIQFDHLCGKELHRMIVGNTP